MVSRGSEVVEMRSEFPSEFPSWMRAGFWLCLAIALAVVARRIFALTSGPAGGPPQVAQLDAAFAGHAILTLLHIVPAAILVLLFPFLLSRRFGSSRLLKGSFFALGTWVGLTAYAMNGYAIGGWIERSAVLLFNSLFLLTLGRTYLYWRREDRASERKWMLRAVAVILGIATTRPVMGAFFATSPLTHLEPSQFFGLAFWIGFSINSLAMELWLRTTARRTMGHRLDLG
jgi:hypothetical protein